VGAAIRAKISEGVIRREDVFITTKVRLQDWINPVRLK
jgi:diketogulonate reductase-like aldo/keto reductase